MWIASKLGWFSIVEKTRGVYHIRARVREDLENLLEDASLSSSVAIQEWPGADYRYRAVVRVTNLIKAFEALLDSVDYPNFKGEISKTPDQAPKLQSYHRIWSEMMTHQK